MANMSYIRFENTEVDLADCFEVFDEVEDLSETEASARRRIIRLAIEIAEEYGNEVE